MQIQRFDTGKSCCGGKGGSIALVLSKPLTADILASLVGGGQYVEAKHMTKAGILYVENKTIVAHGAFNRTQMQVKCKFSIPAREQECQDAITTFIGVLETME